MQNHSIGGFRHRRDHFIGLTESDYASISLMDVYEANSKAWDNEVRQHNYWTLPVSVEQMEAARTGNPGIWVTPFRTVPLQWIESLKGKKVLVACGGGGQQTPILAAYGCIVTTLDISKAQLEQDRLTLEKHGLHADLINGNVLDMPFPDRHFDAVIMPQAMNFIDDIGKLYKGIHRVLKPGGTFIFGTANPILYMFDEKVQQRRLKVKYTIPFSHTTSFSKAALDARLAKADTVEFSHTLDSIIGGLTGAGFTINGFYTDISGSEPTDSFVHDSHLAFLART